MNNMIGVMQGRLLPKFQGRYQAHPVGYWQDEFSIASAMGLDCIEFILDYNDADRNPLLRHNGVDEILAIIEQTGVMVKTICADYFMEAPLHSEHPSIAQQSLDVLRQLIVTSKRLEGTDIILPCVDQATLDSKFAINRFVAAVRQVLDLVEEKAVNLSLETDLSPRLFVELLACFDSTRVTVNYDIGNSAALGYDLVEELDAYGDRITDIHLKDRFFNGDSVILGQGDADFDLFFRKLKDFDYQGPFIMQAYRDDDGVKVFRQQLAWVRPYLEHCL